MDEILTKAIEAEMRRAKVVDLDVRTLPVFDKILEGVKTVEDVPAAVLAMRALKPKCFKSFDDMIDDELAAAEREILDSTQTTSKTRDLIAGLLKGINVGLISEAEQDLVETAMRGDLSLVDVAALERIAHAQRQKVVA